MSTEHHESRESNRRYDPDGEFRKLDELSRGEILLDLTGAG